MKKTSKKDATIYTPETIGGPCMTGWSPSKKEQQQITEWFATRKAAREAAAKKKRSRPVPQ